MGACSDQALQRRKTTARTDTQSHEKQLAGLRPVLGSTSDGNLVSLFGIEKAKVLANLGLTFHPPSVGSLKDLYAFIKACAFA